MTDLGAAALCAVPAVLSLVIGAVASLMELLQTEHAARTRLVLNLVILTSDIAIKLLPAIVWFSKWAMIEEPPEGLQTSGKTQLWRFAILTARKCNNQFYQPVLSDYLLSDSI